MVCVEIRGVAQEVIWYPISLSAREVLLYLPVCVSCFSTLGCVQSAIFPDRFTNLLGEYGAFSTCALNFILSLSYHLAVFFPEPVLHFFACSVPLL